MNLLLINKGSKMKKIEQNLIKALDTIVSSGSGHFRQANTRALSVDDMVEVWLYGSQIASLRVERGRVTGVMLSLCGYNTTTTRSRLNALAEWLMLPIRIKSRLSTPYWCTLRGDIVTEADIEICYVRKDGWRPVSWEDYQVGSM